jgi:hypothetical protein
VDFFFVRDWASTLAVQTTRTASTAIEQRRFKRICLAAGLGGCDLGQFCAGTLPPP